MLQFSTWKTVAIWLVVLLGVAFAIPNFLPSRTVASIPDPLPNQQVTLGLDLQGGSSLLLQVDRDQLVEERGKAIADQVRQALRAERIGYTGLAGDARGARLRLREPDQRERALELIDEEVGQPIDAGLVTGGTVREVEIETSADLVTMNLTAEGIAYRVRSGVQQAIEVLRKRVDELGTTEPVIVQQGDDRILVQVPGLDDPERLKDIIGQTAKLTFQMVDQGMSADEARRGRPPRGSSVLPSADPDEVGVFYLIEDTVIVSGENLTDAQQGFNQQTNETVVNFRFDTRGAQRFGRATAANVGRPFAIVLDGKVISAPVINESILGGAGQISGNFTSRTAEDLALVLRAGALPVELTIVEERTVGPGLGADSIAAGQIAGVIGAVLVLAFMILAYGRLGIIANVALVANILMLLAALTVMGATLTLPGIAGIVLTIGMAVDSNVLIYERIREERRSGRTIVQAIEGGFQKALTTILDANITTLIAAIILFYLGSGPVRGFAVTLAIGIATTVFTAFTLTRWMVAYWYKKQRPKELPVGLVNRIPAEPGIRFMRGRRVSFPASALAALLSLGLFAAAGMNLGIDFRGGSLIEVQAKQGDADVGAIRTELGQLDLGDVQVQEFGTPRDVLIRVESTGDEEGEQAVIDAVRGSLEEAYDFRRVEVVGPTVSSELAFAGTIAVLAALVAILGYIWVRFEWQFAIGAIIATAHDVILTIGMFVITQIEFNLSSIAAVLTIVGYSLNDTVVVYDRVRENLRRYKKKALPELLDLSINQMLSRTILTSVTTLLALGALWLFGGEVIRSFTFAMLFGVVIGTYSSIFIAAPVLILFKLRTDVFEKKEEDEALARFADPAAP